MCNRRSFGDLYRHIVNHDVKRTFAAAQSCMHAGEIVVENPPPSRSNGIEGAGQQPLSVTQWYANRAWREGRGAFARPHTLIGHRRADEQGQAEGRPEVEAVACPVFASTASTK